MIRDAGGLHSAETIIAANRSREFSYSDKVLMYERTGNCPDENWSGHDPSGRCSVCLKPYVKEMRTTYGGQGRKIEFDVHA